MAHGTRHPRSLGRRGPPSRRRAGSGPASLAAAVVLLLPLAATAQQVTDRTEAEVRDWVGSVAGAVYAAAWPTATYEGFRLRGVERLPDGLTVLVRFQGESAFSGALWLDLAFTFRKGQLFDLEVRGHSAILVPPFETTKTLATATMELAREFAEQQPARQAASTPEAPAVADLPGFYERTADDGSLRIVLVREGQPERVLPQSFAADTHLTDAWLDTDAGMEVAWFIGSDADWEVQYWWHLDTDGVYFAARARSGGLVTSRNFDTGPGTVGERMRVLVLEPWLRAR